MTNSSFYTTIKRSEADHNKIVELPKELAGTKVKIGDREFDVPGDGKIAVAILAASQQLDVGQQLLVVPMDSKATVATASGRK